MRNLTILRKDALAGSKKEVVVYIEDRENGTAVIEETPCRRLGTLQCGESRTFSVSEEKLLVYVLDPDPETGLNGDRTQIPAGKTQLYLTGKIRRKAGRPFYFDGPATNRPPRYHSLSSQRGLIVAMALVACFAAPFLLKLMPTPGEKMDTTLQEEIMLCRGEGVTIMLPENFMRVEVEGYDLTFSTMDTAVYFRREPVENPQEPDMAQWDADRYLRHVAVEENVDPGKIQKHGQLSYYTYKMMGSDGSTYVYYVMPFRTETEFWNVRFAVSETFQQNYENAFFTWAESIEFQ